MTNTKKKTTKTKTTISKPIEAEPESAKKKVTSADIVSELQGIRNEQENLTIIMSNILDELKELNKTNIKLSKKLDSLNNNSPRPSSENFSHKSPSESLPPPPSIPTISNNSQQEVPSNNGEPFRTNQVSTGHNVQGQGAASNNSQTSTANKSKPIPIEQAGEILKQKLKETQQQSQQQQPKQQHQIPSGSSSRDGTVSAKPATPLDGYKQVGDISESVKIDWLGESYPEG